MSFKKRVETSSAPLIGAFVKLPVPEVAEILADAGLDFVIIDAEHALLSVRDIYEMLVMYDRIGVPPIVRVTDHQHGDGQRYLDAGATGLMVPHVSNGEVAAAVMSPYMFPPEGTRGMGFSSRAGRWGALEGGRAEYLRVGREDVTRIAMVEEQESIDDIGGILGAPGVDAIFVGPGDLSLSMGVPWEAPEVTSAVSQAIAAATALKVPVGTVAGTPDAIRQRTAEGCQFLVIGNDVGMLSAGARNSITTARESAQGER